MTIFKAEYEVCKNININKKLFKWIFYGIFIIISLILMTCIITKANANTSPPSNGDWIIEEGEEAELKKNHLMRGNVFVNGNLTINGNFILTFDCDLNPGEEIPPRIYILVVNSTGSLIMKHGATIKARVPKDMNKTIPHLLIHGYADIQDSEIAGVIEGFRCEKNSSVKITNTTFRNCYWGIVGIGVKVPDDTTNNFIDVDYDIVQFWEVKIKILNENDNLITKGKVNLTSSNGNITKRRIDENGTTNFQFIKVKEGIYDYNPFTIRGSVHKDEDNETPHITYKETNFNINQNFNENPKIIKINHTLSPDFSIRVFSCNLSYMEVKKINKLSVWIRNMGEESSKAEIKFSALLGDETEYVLIDTKVVDIPETTLHPHHRVDCDWTPIKGGQYNIIVELIPIVGIDPYPYDDNSPSNPIKVNVLEPPTIEITKINGNIPQVGMITSGLINIQGTHKGSYDRIHIWINDERWDYIFNLGLNLVQNLQDRNLNYELKIAFKNNNYPLSTSAFILKIDDNTWEIIDGLKNYKIENTSKELKIYYGLFTKPYKINFIENYWSCVLDSGAFSGINQKIYVNISGGGYLYFDEKMVMINLKNKPLIKINNPKNNDVLTAVVENDEQIVSGWIWKVSPKAPYINNVELIIDGKKRNVILEEKNETYWKWYFIWNIASKKDPVKDGKYIIRVQSSDIEERKSDVDEITLYVDNIASYSAITIPKIEIITKEPKVSVNEEILIKGNAKDDLDLKKIEAKIENGDWFSIVNNINKKNFDWEYSWNVEYLDKGIHTIYFRAVDEETEIDIIEDYYPIKSYNLTKSKALLSDLSIESIKIKNEKSIETTKFRNIEKMIFEININVEKSNRIKQQTIIQIKLSTENKTLGVVDKTISKSISERFTVSIPWTVYGEKGISFYTIEIDLGNALEEDNEENNIDTTSIEILDNPQVNKFVEEEKNVKQNINKILTVIIIGVIILILFFLLHMKNLGKEQI